MLIWRCLRGLQIFQAHPKETERFFLRLPLVEVVYEELLVTEVNVLWRLKADSELEVPESPLYEDLLTTDTLFNEALLDVNRHTSGKNPHQSQTGWARSKSLQWMSLGSPGENDSWPVHEDGRVQAPNDDSSQRQR